MAEPRRRQRISQEDKERLVRAFEERDQDYLTVDVTTLEAINTKLQDRLPEMPTVNVRTIAKHLDGMLYTLKLSRQLPAERNRPEVIQRRQAYAQWFLEEANLNHTIFIHECGFHIWTARNYGRSQRGDRAYRQVCGQRGRNITIYMFGNITSVWFGPSHHSNGWHERRVF